MRRERDFINCFLLRFVVVYTLIMRRLLYMMVVEIGTSPTTNNTEVSHISERCVTHYFLLNRLIAEAFTSSAMSIYGRMDL